MTHSLDRATLDAVVILRNLVDYRSDDNMPTDGDCWLLNAALHLEGRMPIHRVSAYQAATVDDDERRKR